MTRPRKKFDAHLREYVESNFKAMNGWSRKPKKDGIEFHLWNYEIFVPSFNPIHIIFKESGVDYFRSRTWMFEFYKQRHEALAQFQKCLSAGLEVKSW
jgi:hypothetical protein